MRLGQKESAILSAIQFRAAAPVSEIRRETRLPDHTIHYYINRFREDQLIKPALFTNVYALGYAEYEIYFSLAASERQPKQKLIKLLERTENVVWIAELGGHFQYVMTVCARNVQELSAFLDRLSGKYGGIFQEKQIAVISEFHLFRKKYLTPQKVPIETLSFGEVDRQVALDDTDRKILSALYGPGVENSYAVSRATGIPRTTVEFRLKRMTQNGFIKAHIYTLSGQRLGMQVYKLLIAVRGLPAGMKSRLYEFCLRHPHVVNLIYCIGGWDYELTVEVPEGEKMVELSQELSGQFGAFISSMQILPVFRHAVARNFPWA